ncbi:hypothetical protein U1839_12705 [Sphingomonas sp. RT2P30]
MRAGLALISVAALATGCGSGKAEQGKPGVVAARSRPTAAPTLVAGTTVTRQTCPEPHLARNDPHYAVPLSAPLSIPRAYRNIVSSTRRVMTIQSLGQKPVCVELGELVGEATDFRSYNKRFLGFYHRGFEAFGYRLIDRVGQIDIETGDAPDFSEDGTMLASVQLVPEGDMEGDFDAIGIWEVMPDRTVIRAAFASDAVPRGALWQSEGWQGNRCVAFSSIPSDVYAAAMRDLTDLNTFDAVMAGLSRRYFRVISTGGKWRFEKSATDEPCDRKAIGTTSAGGKR